MAKLDRVFQKQFGVNAGASDVGIFGSLAASNPQYSKDPETIQSLNAFLTGWAAETIANNRPALEDFNALDFLTFYQLCYLFQTGVAEWDASTTYYIGSIVNNGSGVLYKSLVDDNLNNAVTDGTKWALVVTATPDASETVKGIAEIATAEEAIAGTDDARIITPSKVRSALNAGGMAPIYACRAWVNFDGTGTVAIRASGNVSSITDGGTGTYRVNFTTAMPDTNFAALASTHMVTAYNSYVSVQDITNSGYVDLECAESNAPADASSVFVAIYR
jgi:hypothetical protein